MTVNTPGNCFMCGAKVEPDVIHECSYTIITTDSTDGLDALPWNDVPLGPGRVVVGDPLLPEEEYELVYPDLIPYTLPDAFEIRIRQLEEEVANLKSALQELLGVHEKS